LVVVWGRVYAEEERFKVEQVSVAV
jgi:hypothetical protein